MLTHEDEKPHKCRVPDCNRTYCDARSLKRHIENAHQNILAAILEGGREEFRSFLPETAYVKTKEIPSEFSMDSNENSSPRSSSHENEQNIHLPSQLRSSSSGKVVPTYTFVHHKTKTSTGSIEFRLIFSFDEEKSVLCQICKKTFKNGAALNGHMRLHGGFNEVKSDKKRDFSFLFFVSFENHSRRCLETEP